MIAPFNKKCKMKKALLVILQLILFKGIVHSQTLSRNDFRFGLYSRDNAKKMENISPTVVSDYKTESFLPSLGEKPSRSVYIKGEFAELNIHNQLPEFFFFFSDSVSTTISTLHITQILRNYPFSYGKTPNDFYLIRLFRMGKKRAYRLEKSKSFSVENKYIVLDIDTIAFLSIPISETAFKVIPESKLPIGQYGFVYKHETPYREVVYDFSIE